MSTDRSAAQDSRSAEAAKRRKRKERAAKARTPGTKEMVSGAGQPLDLSVRRELEERLGHDFSRVRLHTDHNAGALTELLGADAVAVGQDIFFREGTYRPGTADGRRLLAHELLHTVQNPDGLGALRAGRDLGAVSLPQEAIEREAESGAQDSVRDAEQTPEVEPGQATPGWLRYATVDADRNRWEQIDPATLVDRLTNSVVRSLRGDPQDLSKRTRKQLARLPDELLDGVLDRLETRLLSSEHERVLDLVEEFETDDEIDPDNDQERLSHEAPAIEPDAGEELKHERETERQSAEEQREQKEKPDTAPGPEKDQPEAQGATGSTPQNGGTRENRRTPQGGGVPKAGGAPHHGVRGQQADVNAGSRSGGPAAAAPAEPAAAEPEQQSSSPEAGQPSAESASPAENASPDGTSEGGQQGGEEQTADSQAGNEADNLQGTPVASKEESAARNRPGAVDALVAGQQLKPQDKRGSRTPTGSPTASGQDIQAPGALSTLEGVRNQDLGGPEEKAEEDPFGSGSESEVDVGGEEKSAWDIKLQPEDFLPAQDPDVSAVPTADTPDPSSSAAAAFPSFPAPPVTKADQVQAQRDAEDAEDAAAQAEAEQGGADATAGTEPSATADAGVPGGEQPGGLALEQAAAAPVVSSTTSGNPESGADPKAGPVAAQVAVQEASSRSAGGGDIQEQAAKEERGTPAAGETSPTAQEKASPQAAGGQATAPDTGVRQEQRMTDAAPEGRSEPTADSRSPSPARDTQITGGSNADTPGGASNSAASGAQSQSSRQSPAKSRTGAPAQAPAAKEPVPAAAQPTQAPQAPAAAPAPEQAPAPKAAAPQAAPAPRAPSGGGGGGGSKAVAPAPAKKDSAPAPNLSQVSPEAGLATASQLKPHLALQAMSGVSGSVDRTVGDENKALAAAPPSMQRPAGAPQTLEGKPKADAPAQYSKDPAQKSEAPEQQKAEVTGDKKPDGPIEAEKAEPPSGWQTFKMALGFGLGKVASFFGFKVDASELAAKFAGLPTKDEALKQAQVGDAPGVQMQGVAEQTAGEQGASVDTKGQETVATGRDDAARPMGEDQVYPDVPKEQLTAKVPGPQGGQSGAPATGAGTGAVPPDAASAVAEHERGPQFQAAFTQGQKGMSDGRQTKDRDFRDSQDKHKQQVAKEIETNTKSQSDEREKALGEVTDHRADWRKEQDGELKKLGDKKTERHEKVRKDVKDKEEQTDKDVAKQKDDHDKQIQDKNAQAEQDAEKKKNDSVKESGNWVTKAFDWIKNKVIEIKNAIVGVIRAARDAVIGFIKNFKDTVEGWINDARTFIVDTIKNLINDLIQFAKDMVQAIIDLADRIRKLITSLIEDAIALVNKLAAMLKQIVTDLLNALGKLLSDILNVLWKMLKDALKQVVDGIKAVLDYASKLLSALGEWMVIAVDFLSDPGGWLSGLKNSAVDGAKNHLFAEVSSSVKQWFKDKIQEIIGLPKAIFDQLLNGGFTLDGIVKEAWDAVEPQLPIIIGQMVMTKIVAKLIPGAGWVLAVIDFLQTAWGALSAILRALTAVLDWLKAVRLGGAGVLFAKAVASGVVALLETLYQWLLNSVRKYVAKVGQRLKGVAAKLFKRKGKEGEGGHARGSEDKGGTSGEGDRGGAGKPKDQAPKKPGTESDPNKPATHAPGQEAGPGKPKEPADGKKPTGNDKNGKPKEPGAGKSDTRPTPSAKPEPKPEPRPKPEPEPERKTPDDRTPDKPKDPKDSTPDKPKEEAPQRPKDPEETPGTKPKDEAPGRPKPGEPKPGKNTDEPRKPGGKDEDPKKPKGGEEDPRKPKHGEDDKPHKPGEPGEHDPRRPRDKPEKSGPGRPKSKEDKKKRKNEEESKKEKLAIITARIHARLVPKLERGMWDADFRPLLDLMRAWYRLTSLREVGNPEVSVVATLNPSSVPIKAKRVRDPHLRLPKIELKDLKEDGLPKPKFPSFNSGPPHSLEAGYLSRSVKDTGAPPGSFSNPPGWGYVTANGLSAESAWVRMHLLPAALGGMPSNSNLIPARGPSVNIPMAKNLERPAYDAIPDPEPMIWYKCEVVFHPIQKDSNGTIIRGFPKHVTSSYGGYDKIDGTGEKRGDWRRTGTKKSYPIRDIPPPTPGEHKMLLINSAGADTIWQYLGGKEGPTGGSRQIARYIAGLDADGLTRTTMRYGQEVENGHPRYYAVSDVRRFLEERRRGMQKGAMPKIYRVIEKLKELDRAGKIDWRR